MDPTASSAPITPTPNEDDVDEIGVLDATDIEILGTSRHNEEESSDRRATVPPEHMTNQATEQGAVVRDIFSSVILEKGEDGGITLRAPRESADALVALFEGMAKLFRNTP
jgi:hypothetical protein